MRRTRTVRVREGHKGRGRGLGTFIPRVRKGPLRAVELQKKLFTESQEGMRDLGAEDNRTPNPKKEGVLFNV